ncbi:MAG: glycoside hydrolase family 3 N-terminal domain-containing protein [Moheibacter sp.]
MKKVFAVTALLFLIQSLKAQQDSPFYMDSLQIKWVNEKYDSMSLEEKVGQLFIVAAYSNRDAVHELEIEQLVKEENIGGLIFMQDDALKQAELTNRYQKASKIPLLIGMDAEWGLAMRLKDVERFPWAMTIGAIQEDNLVKELGMAIGEQSNRMGVNFNFAPVVDVNTNSKNPIIGNRSFGSDVENVARKGINYMLGMKEKGVLASAKHFPGHGDTSQDSHHTLPVVGHDLQRLNSIELAPFKQLIEAGVPSIMVAHLNIPALDDSGLPTTLSKKVVTDLLKNQLNFKGLIITDALNMAGVANAYPAGEVDLRAFEAGNDILLFSQDVKTAKLKIIEKINSGEITEERLAESVKKILMAKYFVGLNNWKPIDSKNLVEDLNSVRFSELTYRLYEQAATVLKNENNTIPLQNLSEIKVAYVPLEEAEYQNFYDRLQFHVPVELVNIKSSSEISKLKGYDYVIIGLHKSNETVYKSYKISENSKSLIQSISAQNSTILALFGSPYALMDLDLNQTKSVLVFYQNLNTTQDVAAGLIFGASDTQGKLPVDVNEEWKFGKSLSVNGIQRLGFAEPKAVGMNADLIYKIDRLAEDAIEKGATPGLQIVATRKGKVIYNKSFGYQSNEKNQIVTRENLYDVASVTKVTATLPLLMKEVSEGSLNLDQTLESIVPRAGSTNKANLKLREILAHQSGLPPWIGFYKESVNVKNARLYLDYYSRKQDEEHPIKVTDNIYIIGTIKDTIMDDILYSPLGAKKYEYSDLGYYLFQDYLERKYKKPLDALANEFLYEPMGLRHTTYNPLGKFEKQQIIPTERDRTYRNQLVHGYVHDQGAAMMGGVAGHAGLFSTAQDLAKIMQMYLNGGSYGGVRFFSPEVVREFIRSQFAGNRRGAGFDKMSGKTDCKCPSGESFGHTGFTGTMVWADPKEEIVFVFLSNRIHPSVDNESLINKKYRENIRQVLYDAVVR